MSVHSTDRQFFYNQSQKETAEKLKAELDKERLYADPIITEVSH